MAHDCEWWRRFTLHNTGKIVLCVLDRELNLGRTSSMQSKLSVRWCWNVRRNSENFDVIGCCASLSPSLSIDNAFYNKLFIYKVTGKTGNEKSFKEKSNPFPKDEALKDTRQYHGGDVCEKTAEWKEPPFVTVCLSWNKSVYISQGIIVCHLLMFTEHWKRETLNTKSSPAPLSRCV